MDSRSLSKGGSVTSKKRAEQIQAISKMMTVADALNPEGWDYTKATSWYSITWQEETNTLRVGKFYYRVSSIVLFPTEELAKKAIEILGEDVIKTALGV